MPDLRDLWPDDIGTTSIIPPVSILREQAVLLGRKTQQLLRARVDTDSNGPYINHVFVISAPAIDYSLELFRMYHEISLYPIVATWNNENEHLENESELVDFLRKVFGAKDTKKLIHSLLAQARDQQPSGPAEITDEDIPF